MDANEFNVLCTDIRCFTDGLLGTDFESLSSEQQLDLRSRLQDLLIAVYDFDDLGMESLRLEDL